MRSLHRIGIGVVTYQCARHIAPFLRSLAATIDPQRTSICILDNGSTDETVAILKRENEALKLPLRLICGVSDLGYARGNNKVFEHLQAGGFCDVLVLLTPDTVVQPGWWQPLVQALENPSVGVAAPLLLLPDGKINSRGNALHFLGLGYVQGLGEDPAAANLHAPFFFASGAALAIDVEALATMNQFLGTNHIFWDELFLYAEDSDFGWRMRLAGFEPQLCGESRVIHDYRFPTANTIEVETRLFWIERNRYLLLLANCKVATWFLLLPWIMASELALICGFGNLYPQRWRLWRAVVMEINSPGFWPRRSRLQAGRKRSDRVILHAMTGSIRHGGRPFGLADRSMDLVLRWSHRLLCGIVWW